MKHAFLDKYSALESPVHRLDARAKIIAFLALIVISVSTPPEAWTAFLGYGAFLALMAAASCLPVRHILRRAWVIVPFVAMAAHLHPFHEAGGGHGVGAGGRFAAGADDLLERAGQSRHRDPLDDPALLDHAVPEPDARASSG